MNDDMFFSNAVAASDFYDDEGRPRVVRAVRLHGTGPSVPWHRPVYNHGTGPRVVRVVRSRSMPLRAVPCGTTDAPLSALARFRPPTSPPLSPYPPSPIPHLWKMPARSPFMLCACNGWELSALGQGRVLHGPQSGFCMRPRPAGERGQGRAFLWLASQEDGASHARVRCTPRVNGTCCATHVTCRM